MITFNGYESTIQQVYDAQQDHVFAHWDDLTEEEKVQLLDQLAHIDFDLLKSLFEKESEADVKGYVPAPVIRLPEKGGTAESFLTAAEKGEEVIRAGRVAAFVVAGGQGSRLGYDGPKGKFPVGPVSDNSLFQIHAEKILAYGNKYGVTIPWLIMTSRANHEETVSFLKEHNYFGLKEKDVRIFPQGMIPSLDTEGKLILKEKAKLFMNPDGHGGSLTALQTSGTLEWLANRNIDIISYFQIDNPLVTIVDPIFIGFHEMENADVSSKALEKAYPEEKVGIFVKFDDDTMGVMEYSDLPKDQMEATSKDGSLKYSAGSIAIHLFSRKYIEELTSESNISLPFHRATKNIKAWQEGAINEITGYKYEKFVFDALPLTKNNVILETRREEEFAPVKNATGVDSVESARELMNNLYRSWLDDAGVTIPDEVKVLEISPLFAVDAEELKKKDTIRIPSDEKVFLR